MENEDKRYCVYEILVHFANSCILSGRDVKVDLYDGNTNPNTLVSTHIIKASNGPIDIRDLHTLVSDNTDPSVSCKIYMGAS